MRKACCVLLGLALLLGCTAEPAKAAHFTNKKLGYRLTYPHKWTPHLEYTGVVRLRNYPPKMTLRGGIPPKGGAIIVVQAFPPYSNPMVPQGADDDTVLVNLAKHGKGSDIVHTPRTKNKLARIAYSDKIDKYRLVETILHRGGKVFLLTLEYNLKDPHGARFEKTLDKIAAGIRVIK